MKKSEMFDEVIRLLKKNKKIILDTITYEDMRYTLSNFKEELREVKEEQDA